VPPDSQVLLEVYKTIFATWRSQVDSYWQRSNYFAAFGTAAIAGSWYLVNRSAMPDLGASLLLSMLGIWLTIVWYRSNKKTHMYVRHWWDSLGRIEQRLRIAPSDFAQQLELGQEEQHQRQGGIPYRSLIQNVPMMFFVMWTALFLTAVVRMACPLCR